MILLSYIVTVYNKFSYLDRCLKSLLNNKTTDEYEIIVVDDGSNDGSEVLCDEYSQRDARIRIIHQENAGVSSARNTGILAAKGEWITILDGDDYISPNSYNILKKAICKYGQKSDLIYFNGFGETKGKVHKNQFFLKEDVNYSEPSKKTALIESSISIGLIPQGYRHYFSLGAPVCKIIKKNLCNDSSFDESIRFAEDTLFSVNLIQKASGIYYYDTYLYHYCLNSESATHKYRPGLSRDMDVFFRKLKHSVDLSNKRIYRAYYLRAFAELQRCVRNEFYSKYNKAKPCSKKKAADYFLSKEPYKKAISLFRKDKSFINRVKCFFFAHRLYWLYIKLYSIIK